MIARANLFTSYLLAGSRSLPEVYLELPVDNYEMQESKSRVAGIN